MRRNNFVVGSNDEEDSYENNSRSNSRSNSNKHKKINKNRVY